MLIIDAALLDGRVVAIRVGNVITDVADRLDPLPGEDVLDAELGTVLPGLHDHHVHLRSAAAALGSVRVGPPDVRSRSDLARALRTAQTSDDGWIRAVGYHESVAGPLDRALLDELSAHVPVRVQHRSGALWTMNSLGLALIGLAGHPDGRLFRTDAESIGELPRRHQPLRALSARLAAWGVTGVTDATPGYRREDLEMLAAAYRSGELRQRLHCMAPPDISEVEGLTVGPAKRILDDDGLDLEALQRWVAGCHAAGRPVAVHCVTAVQLVVTIAALRAAGVYPGDRIEHAAMVPPDCIADLAELAVTVVTQPNFIAERGDEYLADVPHEDCDQLWRVASLRHAGVKVALSTDMPFGDGDPWAAMRAAVTRRSGSGSILGPAEGVSSRHALEMFLGHPGQPTVAREVAPGQPGDLCVMSLPPDGVLAELDCGAVRATVIGGERVWPA